MLVIKTFYADSSTIKKTWDYIVISKLCWWLTFLFLAPQVAPRNFRLTAISPNCVSLSYDPVLYPNGPESGLVYQVYYSFKTLNCMSQLRAFCTATYSCQCSLFCLVEGKMNMFITEALNQIKISF